MAGGLQSFMLTDAHLHLQDIQGLPVLANIMKLAQEFKVGQFLCNSTRPEDWPIVGDMARGDTRIVPFFGVHPWYAEKLPVDWDVLLEDFLKARPGAGVGEAGLDKARPVDFTRQTEILCRQFEIAGGLGRPVEIHCVRAWSDLLNILRRNLPPTFMVHSFKGSQQVLESLLDLGGYISFSWKCLQRDKEGSIELMRKVPLDRLLLETDFPYTEPGRIGPDAHEKKYFEILQGVYDLAARAKGIEKETLEKAVWSNGTSFLSGTPAR